MEWTSDAGADVKTGVDGALHWVRGSFNYQAPSVESSLFRNGKVLTRRDRGGSDAGTHGIVRDARLQRVANARAAPPSLARHGFELVNAPVPGDLDLVDERHIVGRYYELCERAVASALAAEPGVPGAPAVRVFAFDHNVRSASAKREGRAIAGGNLVQGPAHVVHGDYTLRSAPQRLRDLAQPPKLNDTRSQTLPADLVERAIAGTGGARYAFINLWRNADAATPVRALPLALCDARTVSPNELVVFEIHYADRVGENYFAKHNERHAWSFFPDMARDEGLLIKQWDSAGVLARARGARGDGDGDGDRDALSTMSLHTAFRDPRTKEGDPDRLSIEVRCVAIIDGAAEAVAAGKAATSKL
eukprot:g1205.t1